MNMQNNTERLSLSWIPWLHIDYHSDDFYKGLMQFDINKPCDQDIIIERAIVPNFLACDAVTKKSLLEILVRLPEEPETDVMEVLRNAGPLTEKLQDYRAFFEKVRIRCETLAMSTKA